MDRRIGKLAAPGVILALLVLLANAWLALRNVGDLVRRDRWVEHTQAVLSQIAALRADMAEVVAAERGYLAVPSSDYDVVLSSARAGLEARVATLNEQTVDNAAQQQKIRTLRANVEALLLNVDDARRSHANEKGNPQALRDILTRGDDEEAAVHGILLEMRSEEERLLGQRAAASAGGYANVRATFILSTAIATVLVALAYVLIRRDEAVRVAAALEQNRLSNYNRLLVESTGEGIYSVDLNGRCTSINAAGAKMLRVSQDDVLGKHMHEVTHHTYPDGTPYPAEKCPIYNVFSTGKGCRIEDEVFWRPDGTSFPVEYSAYPILNGKKVEGAVVSFANVSARKMAEEEVRRSEQRYRSLVDASAAIVWGTPAGGEFEIELPGWTAFTGQTFEEYKGWGWLDAVHPEDRDATARAWSHAIENHVLYEVEHQLRRHDGEYRYMGARAAPVLDRVSGRVLEWVGVHSDITRRKLAEDELVRAKDEAEAANVAKSQFLANMSHELRTPLNAVIMYSELLQEEAEDRKIDGFIPDLDKIRSAGRHLLALVNGVLDLSKIEAGKMELFLETFDVQSSVKDVATTVQPLVQKNGNRLELVFSPDIGTMHADMTKVRQILFNLLSNSSKFTKQGTISLTVSRQDEAGVGYVEFQVADSGIGMTDDHLAKLFQPFTQADASTTRKYGGTGLGLAISRRFCEMMGGKIEVKSEKGVGTTFTVRIPARVARIRPSGEAEAVTQPVLTGPAHGTVLIIDDEAAVRDLAVRAVASEGLRAITASDGEEGLRIANEIKPDLIILDVMMPKMDGWAVLTRLKADPRTAEVPVVMLTIMSDKEMGYLLGASEYLTKPVERERLTSVLKRYRPTLTSPAVLVVEDDEATRQVLKRSLEKQGWAVEQAENGRIALDRLKTLTPGLILMDLMMPEMDGFEFLAELRNQEAWRGIPVVVLTSRDLTADERAALSGKVERILQKGAYSREALLGEVRRIVARCAVNPPGAGATTPAAPSVAAAEPSPHFIASESGTATSGQEPHSSIGT